MIILGIDPGKTTGLGLIQVGADRKISLLNLRESLDVTALDYLPWLEEADEIVVESFHVRPNEARRGSFDGDSMVAPQVIGAVRSVAKQLGKTLHLQSPSLKPVGYGWANLKYVKGKKGMHNQDALAHAVYFAVKRLQALPISKS